MDQSQPPETQNPMPNEPVIMVEMPDHRPILTYILLAINIAIYLWTTTLTDYQRALFILDWSKINAFVYQGEAYRLVTSMFMHTQLDHIFGNAFMLFFYGREVERYYGHFRFGLVYFLGGLAGSMGSVIYTDMFNPDVFIPNNLGASTLHPSIGASGAIFAVFSAYAVLLYHHRHMFRGADSRISRMVFISVVYILLGFDSSRLIDNGAHIGGLLGGVLVAWFIAPQFILQQEPEYKIVDGNKIEDWIIMPVLFSLGLGIMIFIVSIQGI